jgi:hypothetical protein
VGVSLKFPSYVPYSIPLTFLLVGGSLAIFILDRWKRRGAILLLIVGLIAAEFFYTLRVVFPLVNPYKSARFLSQEVTSRIQPGEKVGVYGPTPGAYVFYTGIVPILELEKGEEVVRFLQSSERVYCFVDSEDLDVLRNKGEIPKFELIARRQVGGTNMMLISNR